ncbi:MAG: Flp pilus assembly protein CpaB [Steroidobacteraceae bacterium]
MSSTRWILATLGVVAIAGGVGTYWLMQRYLLDQTQQLQLTMRNEQQTRRVIVAAQEIGIGETLSADNLALRPIPVRYLPSDSVTADNAQTLDGRKALVAIGRGEPVTTRFITSRTLRLAAQLLPGTRAVTVVLDESGTQAGLLRPGDLVDVLLIAADLRSGSLDPTVRPLLAAVRVLATGQEQDRIDPEAANNTFNTATLAVSPDEAQRIVLAQQAGRLSLILRAPDDLAAHTAQITRFSSLFATPSGAVGTKRAGIELLIGGHGAGMRRVVLPRGGR